MALAVAVVGVVLSLALAGAGRLRRPLHWPERLLQQLLSAFAFASASAAALACVTRLCVALEWALAMVLRWLFRAVAFTLAWSEL